jgi:hypothetical protein
MTLGERGSVRLPALDSRRRLTKKERSQSGRSTRNAVTVPPDIHSLTSETGKCSEVPMRGTIFG